MANYSVRKGKSQATVVDEKPKESYNSEEVLTLVSSAKFGDQSED